METIAEISEFMRPVVAIAGPTGSGKSELALRIAAEFGGEVVNCDSLQIYRRFDIGTAKLPLAERRDIPHHLIDILDPDQTFTAGEYARLGRAALEDISGRGRLPVVAGGTGFYLRALFDGLFRGPARDAALRERLAARERRKPGSLHRLLARLDGEAAARIHANDIPKVTRALEVRLIAAAAHGGIVPGRPRGVGGLSNAEDRTGARPRGTVPASGCALPADVRIGAGGRG